MTGAPDMKRQPLEALKWYKRAADSGYGKGLLKLAQVYDYGVLGYIERDAD